MIDMKPAKNRSSSSSVSFHLPSSWFLDDAGRVVLSSSQRFEVILRRGACSHWSDQGEEEEDYFHFRDFFFSFSRTMIKSTDESLFYTIFWEHDPEVALLICERKHKNAGKGAGLKRALNERYSKYDIFYIALGIEETR
jgi:hypothetical protein